MAKIDTAKINGYADMTPEQKIAALEAFETDDSTPEIERLRSALTKSNADAAEWKRKHNALLGEEEKKKQEDAEAMASLQEEVKTLRREKAISAHTARLLSLGYEESLAREAAGAMLDGDTDTFFDLQKKHQDQLRTQATRDAFRRTPIPGASEGTGGVDYQKRAEEAQRSGNLSEAAYFTRLNQEQKT